MRIISNFHDYYDCIQKYDEERDLILKRNSQPEIVFEKNIARHLYNKPWSLFSTEYYIGFCGKVYPLLGISKKISWNEHKTIYCYSAIDVHSNFEVDKNDERLLELFFTIKLKEDYFKKYNTPFYVIRRDWNTRIDIAPMLKKYEFFRIFDVNSAYQEIRMYLSNQAQPNKLIPSISDEDLLIAKGFDKFSFRRDKKK